MASSKAPAAPRDHAALAHAYALGVIDGTVAAGPYVIKAAQRHLDDLKRTDGLFRFDADKGAKVCRYIELLPHTKGKWAAKKERAVLEPWQCFLVVVGFGWLKVKNGKRRFRVFYWEIPRKNGKSFLAASIGLYMFTSDGEFGSEVYSGATTERQSWEVYSPARLMMDRTPAFAAKLGVQVCAKTMIISSNGSKFEPIIGNPGDGASPSCAIVDEFHEHDTPAMYDTMETGMGAREQPLLLAITTAGTNIAGPCHEKHDEVCKVLDGVLENDDMFGVVFSVGPDVDWADPRALVIANPNYDVSVSADFLLSQQRQALQSPVKQATFKTKHLNVWTSVLAGAFNMQLWTLAADRMMSLDEFACRGLDCWFGIDLASKSDLCALQIIFKATINGHDHYYWFAHYWLPEAAIEEPGPNHASYVKWREMGLLTQTSGATVDFAQITEEVVSLAKSLNPHEIVYDPFNATQMAQAFMEVGIEAVEFIQQPQNFAVPMDEVSAALKDSRLHHDGNEITAWCMSNVVARPAKKGLFSPVKSKPAQKIDGAIAGIIGMSRACLTPEPKAEARVRWI